MRKPAKGQYTACFRFDGRHYQRSLKTNDSANAQAALGRIQDTIHLLATGRLTIPPGVDPEDFIVTSGAEKAPRSATKVPTLEQFLLEYQASHPAGTKAENTLRTEQIHINHFLRLNKGLLRRSIDQINYGHFQQYIGHRLKAGVSPTTVDKEVATWRCILNHARKMGYLAVLPTENLVLPKSAELPPHRTIEEVRAIIARKGADRGRDPGPLGCHLSNDHRDRRVAGLGPSEGPPSLDLSDVLSGRLHWHAPQQYASKPV